MGSGFDIRRRRRTVQPVSRPSRRDHRAFSSFLFLAALGALILVVTGEMNATQPHVAATAEATTTQPATSTPTPTSSTTPTPSISATPTPSSTPTPTTTPSPITDKSTISMTILNGSGTAGQANTLRGQLESEGFSVRKIAVAPDQHETTTIYHQSGKRAEAEFVAGFIPDRVLKFEENSTLTGPDTLLIVVGVK